MATSRQKYIKNDNSCGRSRRTVLKGLALATLAGGSIGTAGAKDPKRGNGGNNGNGDTVTGMYKALVVYDADGNMYMRNYSNRGLEQGSLSAIDEETRTDCYYKVQYRGSFGDDPYLDMGSIRNNIVCKGYEPDNRNVQYVHESDPRYTGERPSIWGSWEYHVDARRGEGNTLITDAVRPAKHSP